MSQLQRNLHGCRPLEAALFLARATFLSPKECNDASLAGTSAHFGTDRPGTKQPRPNQMRGTGLKLFRDCNVKYQRKVCA
jgi:hypothetical protein